WILLHCRSGQNLLSHMARGVPEFETGKQSKRSGTGGILWNVRHRGAGRSGRWCGATAPYFLLRGLYDVDLPGFEHHRYLRSEKPGFLCHDNLDARVDAAISGLDPHDPFNRKEMGGVLGDCFRECRSAEVFGPVLGVFDFRAAGNEKEGEEKRK